MPSLAHDFMFDVNFGLGNESVFTLVDQEEIAPLPPIEQYFLLLDGTDFLLLDGENLLLL
jgi:hypothetical protein